MTKQPFKCERAEKRPLANKTASKTEAQCSFQFREKQQMTPPNKSKIQAIEDQLLYLHKQFTQYSGSEWEKVPEFTVGQHELFISLCSVNLGKREVLAKEWMN